MRKYCHKMARFMLKQDDKSLIDNFQESLTGGAYRWYMHLEKSSLTTLEDLATAFTRQYRHNMGVTSTNDGTEKEEGICKEQAMDGHSSDNSMESRETGQKVKIPYHVQPVRLSFSTTQKPHVKPQTSNEPMPQLTHSKGTSLPSPTPSRTYPYQMKHMTPLHLPKPPAQQKSGRTASNQKPKNSKLSQVQVPLVDVYHHLFNRHLVSPAIHEPPKPPYPKWYKPYEKCEFHSGAKGHSTEGCIQFKKILRELIKYGTITVEELNHLPSTNQDGDGSGSSCPLGITDKGVDDRDMGKVKVD